MTVQLDALKAEVEGIPSVVQSVVTLLNGIETRLAAVDAAEDATVQAQIDAIRSDIHNNVDTLAQAVAARTPAADEVTDTTAGAPTATEPAPGSVPLGGGNVAQPPAQPDTTSPTAPTGATDETAPSGGTGSDTGGPTGSTADASGPGAGEPTNGGSTGNPPA